MLNITAPYNNQVINMQAQAFRDWMQECLNAQTEQVIKYREYDDGIHASALTARIRAFLNVSQDAEFNFNYCTGIIDSKANRLSVSAFDTEDDQKDTLWDWWRKNRMDRKQGIVHRASVRDGDSYMLVSWDDKAKMPRFEWQHAYAGEGMMAYYSQEHQDEIEFVSKHWRQMYGNNAGKIRRTNLYFPDRIEKYISNDDTALGSWQPYVDDTTDDVETGKLGRAGVSWWTATRTQDGEPLGIPVVHFKFNDTGDNYGRSILQNLTPIQDALNKTVIDVLGAMDTAGYGLLVGFGGDWSQTKVGPGAIAWTSKSPQDSDLRRLAGDTPEPLLRTYQAFVMEMARVSSTPLSHFQISGQVAAEGTMKQQETALVEQIKKTQVDYGNNWEDVLKIGRRLYNVFGAGGLDEDVLIDTVWKDAESRNEKEQAETQAIKVSALGVPKEQAWVELGYDATQRAFFARAAKKAEADAIRNASKMAQATGQAANQNMTQTENQNDNANTGNTQVAA